MWYEGFERIDGNSSGQYDGGPKRLVLHTTEGGLDGSLAAFRNNNSWPHFTLDPGSRRKIQHVDTSVAARALKNLSGGVETNREQAIQVEIVTYASTTQDMPEDQIKWLAETLAPVIYSEGISLTTVPFYGTDAGFTLARANAPQRMSFDQWNNFNGICGHQHVPENDHWDPGKFPIDKFISYVRNAGEEDMAQVLVQPPADHPLAGSWWLSDGMFISWINDGDLYSLLRFLGAKAQEDGTPFVLTTAQFNLLVPVNVNAADGLHVAHASNPRYASALAATALRGDLTAAKNEIVNAVNTSETRQNGAIAQAVVQSEQRISAALTAEIKKIVDAIAAIEIVEGECPECPDPNVAVNQFVDNIVELLNSQRPTV